MLQPMSDKKANAIVKSIVAAAQTGDMTKLTKAAYTFIMLASGFIAHYDYFGFRAYYEDNGTFKADILAFQQQNQWANFRQGERDYEYMMQKKQIYNAICQALQ